MVGTICADQHHYEEDGAQRRQQQQQLALQVVVQALQVVVLWDGASKPQVMGVGALLVGAGKREGHMNAMVVSAPADDGMVGLKLGTADMTQLVSQPE